MVVVWGRRHMFTVKLSKYSTGEDRALINQERCTHADICISKKLLAFSK